MFIVYIHVCVCICKSIYIYIERERDVYIYIYIEREIYIYRVSCWIERRANARKTSGEEARKFVSPHRLRQAALAYVVSRFREQALDNS